ncbi:MAG: hydrogenase expression/formation protein HypE [Bacteroidota bacterium]|nr:hydrogenase expression/formation protein HypE [Bacteroidota bacterium]
MTTTLQINMQCPIPQFDFDVIQLGHGSGGVLTRRLLESGVFSVLDNELLGQKHDGAIFSMEGKMAFSTDSYVVSPLFFPGGDIGTLAVHGTVNDLAMCGAMAQYLSLSFILEEGLPIEEFWQVIQSIRESALKAGVQIVTGDTKVVERGKGDKIYINTSGIGLIHPQSDIQMSRIKTGDLVLLSGMVASHGMAIMSKRSGMEFQTDILSDTCHLNYLVGQLLDRFGKKIHFLRDPTRGGVAGVLNEIAQDARVGIDIREKDIGISAQVEGACEMLGLDPLYVASEGTFIAIVEPDIASEILAVMQSHESSRNASLVGLITSDHPGQVVMESRIGGRRIVQMLPGEQLPRIC